MSISRFSRTLLLMLVVFGAPRLDASVWQSAPKPNFPQGALSRGSEGHVIVRAFVAQDGSVTRSTVLKSSGDSQIDEAARTAVLKWKMNPSAVKPQYATKGFEQPIDFRQEAPVAARYRDRRAYFTSYRTAKIWAVAPFPEYPYHERLTRTEGVTMVRLEIGADGNVTSAAVEKTSGSPNLDSAAVASVRRWRAHKEYAGSRFIVPVRFQIGR